MNDDINQMYNCYCEAKLLGILTTTLVSADGST